MQPTPAQARPVIAVLFRTDGHLPSTAEQPHGHDWLPRHDRAGAAYDGGTWAGMEWVLLDSANHAEGLANRANRDARKAWRADQGRADAGDRAQYGAATVSEFAREIESRHGPGGLEAFMRSLLVHAGAAGYADRMTLED